MYSINFPEMFGNNGAKLCADRDSDMSNLKLLLSSTKKSLFGDPYFGTNLKSYIYQQSNTILVDLIIDDIHLAIQQFMPQLYVERKDIKVVADGADIFVNINCINRLDKQPNMYQINLTSGS